MNYFNSYYFNKYAIIVLCINENKGIQNYHTYQKICLSIVEL